jgi:hypothetical protein
MSEEARTDHTLNVFLIQRFSVSQEEGEAVRTDMKQVVIA